MHPPNDEIFPGTDSTYSGLSVNGALEAKTLAKIYGLQNALSLTLGGVCSKE